MLWMQYSCYALHISIMAGFNVTETDSRISREMRCRTIALMPTTRLSEELQITIAQCVRIQSFYRKLFFLRHRQFFLCVCHCSAILETTRDLQQSTRNISVSWPVLKRARPFAPLLFSTSLYQPPGWFISSSFTRLGGRFLVLRSPTPQNWVLKPLCTLKQH